MVRLKLLVAVPLRELRAFWLFFCAMSELFMWRSLTEPELKEGVGPPVFWLAAMAPEL